MRTLVIGDIHGAMKALGQVLERAGADLTRDRLVFLGDIVDGWSESPELILELIDIGEQTKGRPNAAIFLRGNHDDWCRKWLESGDMPQSWLVNRGQSTVTSLGGFLEKSPVSRSRFLDFFRSQRPFYIDEQNRCYVHAGYQSKKGCGHDKNEDFYLWDRTLVQEAMAYEALFGGVEGARLPPRLRAHREVFVGHTPTTMFGSRKPLGLGNLWLVDTGAGWDGYLTVMDADTKEYWQSDPVPWLYRGQRKLF